MARTVKGLPPVVLPSTHTPVGAHAFLLEGRGLNPHPHKSEACPGGGLRLLVRANQQRPREPGNPERWPVGATNSAQVGLPFKIFDTTLSSASRQAGPRSPTGYVRVSLGRSCNDRRPLPAPRDSELGVPLKIFD